MRRLQETPTAQVPVDAPASDDLNLPEPSARTWVSGSQQQEQEYDANIKDFGVDALADSLEDVFIALAGDQAGTEIVLAPEFLDLLEKEELITLQESRLLRNHFKHLFG